MYSKHYADVFSEQENGGTENDDTSVSRAYCGCVGYGYVPVQTLGDISDTNTAIASGTIFPELSLTIDEYGSVCKSDGGGTDE